MGEWVEASIAIFFINICPLLEDFLTKDSIKECYKQCLEQAQIQPKNLSELWGDVLFFCG